LVENFSVFSVNFVELILVHVELALVQHVNYNIQYIHDYVHVVVVVVVVVVVIVFDIVVVFVLVVAELYVVVMIFDIAEQEHLNFVVEVLEVMQVVVDKLFVLVADLRLQVMQ
jgi:hypothetical protein